MEMSTPRPRNALLVGGMPGCWEPIRDYLATCGVQIYDHWSKDAHFGSRVPDSIDVVIVINTQVGHSLVAQVRKQSDARGLPIAFTPHTFAHFPSVLAKWGYVPLPAPAPAQVLPPPPPERTSPLVPLTLLPTPEPAPVFLDETPPPATPPPIEEHPVVQAAQQKVQQTEFVVAALKASPTLTGMQIEALIAEKFGEQKPLSRSAIYVLKNQASGKKYQNPKGTMGTDADPKWTYVKELLAKNPATATHIVQWLVGEKFGSMSSRKEIAAYRLKTYGIQGGRGGLVYDAKMRVDREATVKWKASIAAHPNAPTSNSAHATRRETLGLAPRPLPPPPREEEEETEEVAQPRDEASIQREITDLIATLRVSMKELNIAALTIPAEGEVTGERTVVQKVSF